MINTTVAAGVALGLLLVVSDPNVIPDPTREDIIVEDETKPRNGGDTGADGPGSPGAPVSTPKIEYRYERTCGDTTALDSVCRELYVCPIDQDSYNVWHRENGGPWQFDGIQCRGGPDTGSAISAPLVTPADVMRIVRRLPLPKATLTIQPAGRTLVNLDTIFSTTPPTFDRTVTILGQRVHLTATPSRYTWHFGDGTTTTTTGPGKPYPATDITHRYTKANRAHQARVDVTFTISYTVDGGPTQTLTETITTNGITNTLTTHEAIPVLID